VDARARNNPLDRVVHPAVLGLHLAIEGEVVYGCIIRVDSINVRVNVLLDEGDLPPFSYPFITGDSQLVVAEGSRAMALLPSGVWRNSCGVR
jgi:hypothetical protein